MREPTARPGPGRNVAAAEVGHHTNAGEFRQQGGVLQLRCAARAVEFLGAMADGLSMGAQGTDSTALSCRSPSSCLDQGCIDARDGVAREGRSVQLVGSRSVQGKQLAFELVREGQIGAPVPGGVFQQSPPEQHPPHPARCQTSVRCRDHPWLWRLAHSPLARAGGEYFTGRWPAGSGLLTTVGAWQRPRRWRQTACSRDRCCCLALLGDGLWVLVLTVDAELKMQVRPVPSPWRPRHPWFGLFYRLAILDVNAAQVGVHGHVLVAVLDEDHVAKTVLYPANSTTPSPPCAMGCPVGLRSRCPDCARQVFRIGASAS